MGPSVLTLELAIPLRKGAWLAPEFWADPEI
jgi:hypothetical protein